jgi:hypothetical protein
MREFASLPNIVETAKAVLTPHGEGRNAGNKPFVMTIKLSI